MAKNRLAIIVLNWNGADDTLACVESLMAQTTVPDIILVDNFSSDDSVERFESYITGHPDSSIYLIKNPVNSGYAGGENVGIRYALSEGYAYIGTLNPDATADQRWTHALVDELDTHPGLGIVTGILARSDRKTVDSTGDFYTTWGIPGPRGRDGLLVDAPKEPEYIFGATGGGFVARREVFEKIGLFDEKFFMYFEDVDLCFRAQLTDYKVRYIPDALAYHKLSASTNKVPGLAVTQTFKNLPMLFVKNVPLKLAVSMYPRFVLAYTLILGHAIVKGRGVPALKGWLLSWKNLIHMFRERRRIQSSRTVSDEYIASIILHDIPPEQTGLRKFRSLFTGRS